MLVVRCFARRSRRGKRARRGVADRQAQFHFAFSALGIFENQRHGDFAVFEQRLLSIHQHDVVTTGLEFDGLACGQVKQRQRAHFHHIALHLHLMHLAHARHR